MPTCEGFFCLVWFGLAYWFWFRFRYLSWLTFLELPRPVVLCLSLILARFRPLPFQIIFLFCLVFFPSLSGTVIAYYGYICFYYSTVLGCSVLFFVFVFLLFSSCLLLLFYSSFSLHFRLGNTN